jgi:hypothetical protein
MALQVRNTVWADPVGNGGAVIPKERRHVLLRQPQTFSLVAVTPGTAGDQGVGQHPKVIHRSLDKAELLQTWPGLPPEQPGDGGAEELARGALAVVECGWPSSTSRCSRRASIPALDS